MGKPIGPAMGRQDTILRKMLKKSERLRDADPRPGNALQVLREWA